ncbi:hypothetical protein SAMN05216268_116135 [Streptomyces yunnanensis]|uniref:Uncharacterized protein n=1 Tax=Streptomyces yunnanensis TaxID=156453 RepID=A0A9X8QXX3_9ACTN|nr:hypothetical protein SAMN05216268_116135 [Streptomyces yunnanensis]
MWVGPTMSPVISWAQSAELCLHGPATVIPQWEQLHRQVCATSKAPTGKYMVTGVTAPIVPP